MWRLTWSLFCDPEWKPALLTFASPPPKERRVERWTSNALACSWRRASPSPPPLSPPWPASSRNGRRRAGHYFASAVVPGTLFRGSLPRPRRRKETPRSPPRVDGRRSTTGRAAAALPTAGGFVSFVCVSGVRACPCSPAVRLPDGERRRVLSRRPRSQCPLRRASGAPPSPRSLAGLPPSSGPLSSAWAADRSGDSWVA